MTRRSRRLVVGAAAAIVCACGGSKEKSSTPETPRAQRLAGSWMLRLRVARLRFEPVDTAGATSREVTGSVALVANHWLDRGSMQPGLTHYGSYDIDFGRLGFDPRVSGQPPRVEAGMSGPDSVDIVFEPDARERLRLRGAWGRDSIAGHWLLDADRTGADAEGSFVMLRRRAP